MLVSQIMTTKLITLHPKDKIKRAEEIFNLYNIHHIPIVIMDKVVGILSQGDVLFLSQKPVMHSFDQFIKEQKLSLGTIDEIMTTQVITVPHNAQINDVAALLVNKRINAVPVVNEGKLCGILTSYDLLKLIGNETLKQVEIES